MQNDNEIIKAFEHVVKSKNNHIPITGRMLLEDTFDLVNRQKEQIKKLENIERFATKTIEKQEAEIERLQKENEELGKAISKAYELNKFLEATRKFVREEAIKEFERRIKAHAYYIDVPKEHRVIDEDDIDAILKEMTEESV